MKVASAFNCQLRSGHEFNPYGWPPSGETRYVDDRMRVVQERKKAYTRGSSSTGRLREAAGFKDCWVAHTGTPRSGAGALAQALGRAVENMNDSLIPGMIIPSTTPATDRAFTLIELLVVVAIIGVLAGLLVSGLHSAKEKGTSVRCIGNLRQIGLGAAMYADENGDQFHHVSGRISDHGQWTVNPWTDQILSPNHPSAYWGVAYRRHLGGVKKLFRCPNAQHVDEWREEGLPYPASFWLDSTYGINRYVVTPFDSATVGPLKIGSLKSPQTTILAQDAAEQRLEGETDSLGLFPGQSEILGQWRFALQRLYPERAMWLEWYRHRKRCNTLWVPGHVSAIPFNGFDKGVDYRCYTGATPMEQPRF